MLVKIKRTCRAGGNHLEAGQTVDLEPAAARDLIAIGRAEKAAAPEMQPKQAAAPAKKK